MIHRGKTLRNTVWMLFAQGGRIAIQSVYFIILAKELGAGRFGILSAELALVMILYPFAGWGSGGVMLMNVSRDHSRFPVQWGNALLCTGASFIVFTALAMAVAAVVLPGRQVAAVVAILSVTEYCFLRFSDLSAQAFQAFERLRATALLQLMVNAFRLAGIIIFTLLDDSGNLLVFAWYYLISTSIAAAISVAIVSICLGMPKLRLSEIREVASVGLHFSLGLASRAVHTDIDKALLARLATAEAAGVYSAAYKIVNAGIAPVMALLSATFARVFKAGESGLRSAVVYSIKLLPVSIGWGLLAGVALYYLAPVTPLVLGRDFGQSVDVLRYLAIVPVIQSLHFLMANTLTGAGFHPARSFMQISAALVNLTANLILIPHLGWRGAALATIISESFTLAGMTIIILWYIQSSRKQ